MSPRRKSKPDNVLIPEEREANVAVYTERPTPIFNPQCVVDIIVPVGPRHIEAMRVAVRSVEQQTIPFPLWRIIVINDTGRDISASIPRDDILLINNRGAHGSSYARNLGLDAARAPFVLFLDADDWLLNTALELYLKAYAMFDTGYVYGDAIVQYSDGKQGYHPPSVHSDGPDLTQIPPQYDRSFYLRANHHQITALIPTALAQDVRFDTRINILEDYDFYMHMAAKGYCGTRILYPVIVYNWDAGSNRETSHYLNATNSEGRAGLLTAQIREKWRADIEGVNGRPRMSCCGSGQSEQEKARAALRNSINPSLPGDVPMEWLGRNGGAVRYTSPNNTGRAYDVSANMPQRFFMCHPSDVYWMSTLGAREQPKPSVPLRIPSASEFVTSMRVQPNAQMVHPNENTVVVPPSTDEEFKEL